MNIKIVVKYIASPLALLFILSGCSAGVLDPKGPVASTQYDLIIYSIILMSVVLVPVFIVFGYVVYKYRERPENKDYEPPEIEGNKKLEVLWTVIPIIIVTLLAVPTVKATYDLETSPSPKQEPLVIKVTSAQWKWIFQYPEQGIQTVNYAYIPVDVPVKFVLTSAGAMNSFWVPQLGGQSYTMAGMKDQMFLEASEEGVYRGKGANFTGRRFADMKFKVTAESQRDFNAWVKKIKTTKPELTIEQAKQLMIPGTVGKMAFSSYPANFKMTQLKEGVQNEPKRD
ncbi:cytochrome aa3 quinol oxidase subunit II [Halobacillus amylolyticus]|uniref:Quinol oxidase subunit 2 n=1 Tax=Halobacillus amylolyticus TaxID=2932259 RepID=A0ABY4HHH0_9BACI|nr:cytochrome aa3 quinol oxidase subunit II [Halobacillus amylolyticus]UOR14132.1 cytochrome aa3 quinol oxidase subunit II [Halobacillus amylolyticus]